MRCLSLAAFVCAVAAALPASAQEKDSKPVTIPLSGLSAGCCEQPVQKALGKIATVESVKLRKEGGSYFADVVVKKDQGLALSDVDKALGEATKEMGQAMGTTYKVADALGSAQAFLYKTKAAPDEGKLKAALGSLSGFKSLRVAKDGFGVVFSGEKPPTLAEVKKAAGIEIADVVLAAAWYGCPMHPNVVSLEAGKCSVCGMDLTAVSGAAAGCPCCGKADCKDCGGSCKKDGKGCGDCDKKEEKKDGCGGCEH